MQQFPFRVEGVYFNSHSTSTPRFSLCALCGLCAETTNPHGGRDLLSFGKIVLVAHTRQSLQAFSALT